MTEGYPDIRERVREKASDIFRRYSVPRWMLFMHDTTVVFITFLAAYILRFNMVLGDLEWAEVLSHSVLTALIYVLIILITKSYAGLIRHTTLTDISLVFVSTTSSAFILIILSLILRSFNVTQLLVIPISVILIHYVLITVALFFMRVSVKMLFRFATSSIKHTNKLVLIYGAGDMGFIVKRVLLSDPRGGFKVFGFIDDSRRLQGI